MIILRQKKFSFLGLFKKKEEPRREPRKFIPFTSEIEKEIKKILPREYTKLQDFSKYLGKLESDLDIYPEFGVCIYNNIEDFWDMMQLEYNVSNVSEFTGSNNKLEILCEYNGNDKIFWNFKLHRWETQEGKMLLWGEVKKWIIDIYESEKKWFKEDYSNLEADGSDFVEYCDRALKKAKIL